jgi:hypothetical protein
LLHALPIKQVQLDALYAVLRTVRDGDVHAVEAIERLSRSPTGMKRSVFVRFCCQPLARQWRMACIVCVSTCKSSRTSVVKVSYVVMGVIRSTLPPLSTAGFLARLRACA